MNDEATGKTGKPWTQFEVEATVATYFRIVDMERRGERYVKAEVIRQLQRMIPARSEDSIGYKMSNISAVLNEIGQPWIEGYKPLPHVQADLRPAVAAHLAKERRIAEGLADYETSAIPPAQQRELTLDDVLVARPNGSGGRASASKVRLNGGPLPALRDFQAKQLGDAGEEWVVNLERGTLWRLGRPDLADKVRWTAREDGDGAGYDVTSFFPDGRQRLIEVKTTNYGIRTPFYITRWEVEVSERHSEEWSLYRVHGFARDPRIYILDGSVSQTARLEPKVFLGLPI